MKNIKISLLLVLVVFFQKTAFTQNFVDSEIKVDFGTSFPELNGQAKLYQKSSEHLVSVKFDKEIPIVNIQSFDIKSLNFLGEIKEFNLGGNSVVEGFNELKGRFYLFFSRYDKKMKVEQLFVREINPKSASFNGEEKLLLEVDSKIRNSIEKTKWFTNLVWGKYGFVKSPNDEKFLIYYSLEPEIDNKIKENDVVGIHVFNGQLLPVWSNTFDLPYNENSFDLLDFNVRSTGEVCFLAKKYNYELSRNSNRNHDNLFQISDREDGYKSMVFMVDKNHKTLHEMKIDGFYKTLIFEDNENEDLSVVGFSIEIKKEYENREDYDVDINEICNNTVSKFIINEKGVLTLKYKLYIPSDIIKENSVPLDHEKNKNESISVYKSIPGNLKIKYIRKQNNGSSIIVAEEEYLSTFFVSSNTSSTVGRVFYGFILVLKVSAEGELIWTKKIPKHQLGKFFLDAMSFSYLTNKDRHYFFYLDNLKNLNIGKDEVPLMFKSDFMVTKIDDNNENKVKNFLFDINKINSIPIYNFQTRRIVKVSETEMLVEVYKKKGEDVWIRIKLQ